MSTSELYQIDKLKSIIHKSTTYKGGDVFIHAVAKKYANCCPVCGSMEVVSRGCVKRTMHLKPTGDTKRFLVIDIPRVECYKCDIIRQVDLKISSPRKSYTYSFEKYIIKKLYRNSSIKAIAQMLDVDWSIIKDIIFSHLIKKYKRNDYRKLEYIAIDEISYKRGHKYLTLVLNLNTGNVIYVSEGKDSSALDKFWVDIGPCRAKKIKAVAIDLGKAYQKAVREHLPSAVIVFDHYHVTAILNKHLDEVRRSVYRKAGESGKKVMEGVRWILMYNNENLKEEFNHRQRLEEALSINRALAIAYYLKEEIRLTWQNQITKDDALIVLKNWANKAISEEEKTLQKMGNFIYNNMTEILNWYDHKINSGKIEGLNNKIKVLKRVAYGYRDLNYFALRIMDIHNAKIVSSLQSV
jgi:transposase